MSNLLKSGIMRKLAFGFKTVLVSIVAIDNH